MEVVNAVVEMAWNLQIITQANQQITVLTSSENTVSDLKVNYYFRIDAFFKY